MGPIFDAYEILSCVPCLNFFNSLFWIFISRVSMMSLGLCRFCFGRFFVYVLHQRILSFGSVIDSIIGYTYRYFTSIQRRSSYFPFTPPCCANDFDMTSFGGWNPPWLFGFWFLSWTHGWGVLVCP